MVQRDRKSDVFDGALQCAFVVRIFVASIAA